MRNAILILCLLGSHLLQAQFSSSPHPRLWLNDKTEETLRKTLAEDPLAASLQHNLIAQADELLEARTCRYEIPDGRRLLAESRRALQQTMICAWAYRSTGREAYLKRAIAELEAACALKDWNPSHFLDTAEMATAVAIGYDWLHTELNPTQRQMCETAIRDKALNPAKKLYDGKVWWNKATNNWAQVCGSGIALASIAIQNNDDPLTTELIRNGLDLVNRCEHFYTPDGLYPEGPGYWHYGTNYHIMLIAACANLGQPAKVPAILEPSGDSMIHLHGPTQLPFNFADGKAYPQTKTPAQTWIAKHFANAGQINDLRQVILTSLHATKGHANQRFNPLHLLWLPAATTQPSNPPLHAAYHGEQAAATFRTGWTSNDTWLAIKGGTSQGGHSQMDAGTFCYDAHGTRWIHDLGNDNYNLPGYFGRQRFDYFRNQNRSHNTLEINGQLQQKQAAPSPLIKASTDTNPASASFDLGPAYQNAARSVTRSVHFDAKTGATTLTDDITEPAGEVVWRAMTDATITIQDDTATLTKKNASITLQQLAGGGTWSVESASPPSPDEDPNKGFQRLTLTVPKKSRITIQVAIRP